MHTNILTNNNSKYIENFSYFALVCLSISVSLGVALVSISSMLVLIAFLLKCLSRKTYVKDLSIDNQRAYTNYSVLAALTWMGITGIWTMSNFNDSIHQFLRYLRISIIPLVFYIIESPEISIKIIKFWIITQFFVILNSYALWLGFSVPWVINEHSMRDLTPFTSTLEQPIMNTLMFVVTWYFRKDIAKSWGKPTVYLILILCLFEIFFIMMGRTGFLSMIIALSLITFWSLNRKMRFIALIMPFLLFIGLNYSSPVFKTKFQEVIQDVKDYKSGRTDTSQGNRIDFTARSLQAIELRPILGYGVGSWPIAYKIALNGEKGKEGADNPHEQYLLWFVEGGIVAFFMLIIIYMSVVIDALRLPKKTQKSLLTIIIILALIGLLNCPLHGAGMSEYFCLLIALLLRNPESATKA